MHTIDCGSDDDALNALNAEVHARALGTLPVPSKLPELTVPFAVRRAVCGREAHLHAQHDMEHGGED